MITYATTWQGQLYNDLVQHFDSFSPFQRRRLALFYGCVKDESRVLANHWCMRPDDVRRALREELDSPWVWETIEHLTLEHDVPLLLDWLDGRQLRTLIDVGIVREQIDALDLDDQYKLPGAMASVLAPMVKGMRPSLPIILGRMPIAEVHRLASLYEQAVGPGVTSVLALSDFFSDPTSLDKLMGQLPGPEWLGGALVVLELGGVCFWQEVFGGLEDRPVAPDKGAKVVPLMSRDARNQERDIAQTLLEKGLIFRLSDDAQPHDLVAIPEEVWHSLWMVGRLWLMDWSGGILEMIREGATRSGESFGNFGLHPCLKWLYCELSQSPISYVLGNGLPPSLVEKSSVPTEPADDQLVLGLEIGLFEWSRDGEPLVPSVENRAVLDKSRGHFVRQSLSSWVNGSLGQRAESRLAAAVGVDEQWRRAVLELLERTNEPHPSWLVFEGVPSEMTGAGYLRPLDTNEPELLMVELHSIAAYIGVAKILWLDLLATMTPQSWVSVELITELFQLCCACALFEYLSHILENPGMAQYMPVQRASFLTDAFHVAAFFDWMKDTLEHFLVPLGVAVMSADGLRVCLDTRQFSIECPFELPDDYRLQLCRDILQEPDFELPSPPSQSSIFGVVGDAQPGQLPLTMGIDELISRTHAATINAYNGKVLTLADV